MLQRKQRCRDDRCQHDSALRLKTRLNETHPCRFFPQVYDWFAARRATDAAIDYLRGSLNCTGRIGSIGYCMGGSLSGSWELQGRICRRA